MSFLMFVEEGEHAKGLGVGYQFLKWEGEWLELVELKGDPPRA